MIRKKLTALIRRYIAVIFPKQNKKVRGKRIDISKLSQLIPGIGQVQIFIRQEPSVGMHEPTEIGVGRYNVINEQHLGKALLYFVDAFLETELAVFQHLFFYDAVGCHNDWNAGQQDN